MSYQTKILRSGAVNATTTPTTFDESYYKTGNYRDYLDRKFALLAQEVVAPVDVKIDARILDFGCGCGGLVAALYDLGFRSIYGSDISKWAIASAQERHPDIAVRFNTASETRLKDAWRLIIALDVLEHAPEREVQNMLTLASTNYLALRIPVCAVEGQPFVLPVSNNDPTHVCCHTKEWWQSQLTTAGFTLHHTYAGKAIYDSPGVFAAIYQRTTPTTQ